MKTIQALLSKQRNRLFQVLLAAIFFASIGCEKEDVAIVLPPPGPVSQLIADMGINYDTLVFVDLSSGATVSHPNRAYDLAFEASPGGFRVYLNTGKLMFATHTGSSDILVADTVGAFWKTDDDNLADDSLAIFNNTNTLNLSANQVFIIDRGRPYYSGTSRFRKIKFISSDDSKYSIQFCNLDNSALTDFTVTKDANYSLMYFSFENNGELVSLAPPKADWDIVFTRFTHTYYEEPLNSPFRYYLVSGALLNKWNGSLNALCKKDSTAGYISFDDVIYSSAQTFSLNNKASTIGFDWKYYDFNSALYLIRPDQYYLLKDQAGYYFKLKFIDYYNSQGNKGAAKFLYQRL